MAKITMNATIYKLDGKLFEKFVRGFMRQEMQKGVQLFLKAALPKIPQRTGFLRGSFTRIAEKFSAVRDTRAGKPGYFKGKEYYKGRLKTPTGGVRYATAPDRVLVPRARGFTFQLGSTINYYNINDFRANFKVPSAPWESLEAGFKALSEYLKGADKRFPNIKKIMNVVKIRTSGGTTEERANIEEVLRTRKLLIQE